MKTKTIEEVEYKGKKYPVVYRHERDYRRYHPQNGTLIIEGRTVAFVEFEEEILEAFAECSILDQYNKHLGRVITAGRLQKALKDREYLGAQQSRIPSKVVLSSKPPEDADVIHTVRE